MLRVFSSHFPSLEATFGVDFRHKHGFHYSVGHLFLTSHLFLKKISFTACNFSLNYILTIGNTSTLLIYQTTFSYFRVMKKKIPQKMSTYTFLIRKLSFNHAKIPQEST